MKTDICCRKWSALFKNKCCIACLVFLALLISAIVVLKIILNDILSGIEEDSFNVTTVRLSENEGVQMGNEIDSIEIPEEIKRAFEHTFAGFDFQNQPVWIFPCGKWDIKGILNANEENDRLLKMYAEQRVRGILKTLHMRNSTKGVIIVDADGYTYGQLMSYKTVAFILQMAKTYQNFFDMLDYGFGVNVGYFAETLLGIATPFLGTVLERIQVMGADSEKFIPEILKKVPSDQLPPEYGGSKGYKPIQVIK